jgi:hypothetical protein
MAWLDVRMAHVSARAIGIAVAGWIALLILLVAVTSRAIAHGDAVVVRYIALAIGAIAFALVWHRMLRPHRAVTPDAVALLLIPLLAASVLTYPIVLSPVVKKVVDGVPVTTSLPDPQVVWGLTPGLLTAIQWLQDHSSINAVFAVSNHWGNAG